MAERSRGARLRLACGSLLAFVLVVCLIGIGFTGPVVVKPRARAIRLEVSPLRLREHVETLCGPLAPRDARHPENLSRAAVWITETLAAAGTAVEHQDYATPHGRGRNVIGRLPGADPTAAAVIVGAHYDAPEGSPGADDNASGVAALLELAATTANRPTRGDVYFVFFGSGVGPAAGAGSREFAARFAARRPPALMLALDGVGFYAEAPASQRFPLPGMGVFYPSRGDFVAVVGDARAGRWIRRVKEDLLAAQTIPVHSFRIPARFAADLGLDQLSFRRAGLAGVLVSDTARLRSPGFGSATDQPDTLDYARMARLVEALQEVLADPPATDRSGAGTTASPTRQR